MHNSEGRYSAEMRNVDLAMRLLHHGVRTQTISNWTRISKHRIASLYHTATPDASTYLARHRGQSPHKPGFFMRSQRMQTETTHLARVLSLIGAVPPAPGVAPPELTPEWGHLICDAYDMYAALSPCPTISMERGLFLVTCLVNADPFLLDNCVECSGLVISETFAKGLRRCSYCSSRNR